MRAKKSLGQNFLNSEKALNSIANAADVSAQDVVLEIGPGKGVLTERLILSAGKVVAVEKDDGLFELLKDRFAPEIEEGKLDLIHADILEFDPSTLSFYKDLDFKIVANIPYNLTGAIIRKFLSASYQPQSMVILVQKEVAERIAKSEKESILSLSVKAYGKPKYVETVKAGSFVPAPQVDSAILAIEGISKGFFDGFSEDQFFQLLHAGFSSKRKKLSSNLANLLPKEEIAQTFHKLGLSDNTRAEDLDIKSWRKLAESLKGHM